MARASKAYVCQACGAVTARWSGKCASCGEWNSIVEETSPLPATPALVAIKGGKGRPATFEGFEAETIDAPRFPTGIAEFDRVLGGGLVPGSAVLVGGDPGIGKSTLLLQAAAELAASGASVVYLSGEEAPAQVRMRAARLGLAQAPVALGTETNLANIVATLAKGTPPALVVIDSVQTLWSEGLEAAPGTISQLRGCASALVSFAKKSGSSLVLVGHVTKDGQIAGPKVIEHMVDTVLYFEGQSGHQFRILRAVKNRFGPTDEIGVFEMRFEGLKQVENPSALFLSDRETGAPGTAVFAGMEGTRPILVEIQALVAPSLLSMPRRAVVGWDPKPARHADRRPRGKMRGAARSPRRLSQCRRRIEARRSGGGPRRRRGSHLLLRRATLPRGRGLFRRGEFHRRGQGRRAHGPAPEGGGEAGLQPRRPAAGLRARPRARAACTHPHVPAR